MKPRETISLILLALLGHYALAQDQLPPRWPQFRGVDGSAQAQDEKPLPVHFGPGKNELWKTPIPAGLSSPCIWGNRLFITGHDVKNNKLETLCLDRHKGTILWRRPAPVDKIQQVYKVNSPAVATPTTDGQRLYVAFGSFGLLCYDLDGNDLWKQPLPIPPIGFGPATSPMVVGELVLLNGQGKDLHLIAFQAKTGEPAWRTEESPFGSSFPTPFVWKHQEAQEIILPGRGGLMAYDLKNGRRRWWITGLSIEANTTPTMGEGMLFVASHLPGGDPDLRMKLPDFDEMLKKYDKDGDGKLSRKEAPADLVIFKRGGKDGVGEIQLQHMYGLFDTNGDGHIDRGEWQAIVTTPFNNSLLAIRPGGQRDVGKTHIAWQAKRGVPEVPSPLFYQGRLYLVRNGGILTCLDAKTGKEVYRPSRLNDSGMYYASPVAGDGKVYIAADSGTIMVLKAGGQFEILAENDLGESIGATPALVDGVLYVRASRHMYAFKE